METTETRETARRLEEDRERQNIQRRFLPKKQLTVIECADEDLGRQVLSNCLRLRRLIENIWCSSTHIGRKKKKHNIFFFFAYQVEIAQAVTFR